eukprot:4369393-Pleurochrysis_carterae.AAC.2
MAMLAPDTATAHRAAAADWRTALAKAGMGEALRAEGPLLNWAEAADMLVEVTMAASCAAQQAPATQGAASQAAPEEPQPRTQGDLPAGAVARLPVLAHRAAAADDHGGDRGRGSGPAAIGRGGGGDAAPRLPPGLRRRGVCSPPRWSLHASTCWHWRKTRPRSVWWAKSAAHSRGPGSRGRPAGRQRPGRGRAACTGSKAARGAEARRV